MAVDLTLLLYLLLVLVIIWIALFLTVAIFTGYKELEMGYVLRLFLIALGIVVGAVVAGAVVGFFAQIIPGSNLGILVNMLLFIIAVYLIHIFIASRRETSIGWEKSMWMAFIVFAIMVVLDYIIYLLSGQSVLSIVI